MTADGKFYDYERFRGETRPYCPRNSHGKKFNLGLEAGSKPELHAVIAVQAQSDSLIICNGYKDESYIELALLAQKMGKRIFIVVEKLNELDIIEKVAKKLNVKPNIGRKRSLFGVFFP